MQGLIAIWITDGSATTKQTHRNLNTHDKSVWECTKRLIKASKYGSALIRENKSRYDTEKTDSILGWNNIFLKILSDVNNQPIIIGTFFLV